MQKSSIFSQTIEKNRLERERVYHALVSRGFQVYPSVANFILFDLDRSGAEVTDALLRQGVIVRPMAGYGLPTCIRVTIGLPEQNDRFLTALDTVL